MDKKLLTILLLGIFMINLASAFEFDNVKSYDPVTRIVTITNAFGYGDIIGEARLNTPLNVKVPVGYRKVGEFDLWAYQDYNDALKPIKFKNMKNNEEEIRDYDYKYLSYEEVLVDDYTLKCSDVFNEINNSYSQKCENVLNGSHYETKQVWNKITPADLKKNEVLTIGIFTEVKEGDYMDWIPTIYGEEVTEWATWETDINPNTLVYYQFENITGDAIDVHNNYNATIEGTTRGVTGKIGKAFEFDGINDKVYTTEANLNQDWVTIGLWVKIDSYGASTLIAKSIGTAGQNYWQIRLETGGEIKVLSTRTAGTFSAVTASPIPLDTWYYLNFINNETGLYLYTNGELNVSVANNNPIIAGTIQKLSIGYDNPIVVGDRWFTDGTIDEIMIYNGTLSLEVIQFLYNNGTGLTYEDDGITDQSPTITLNSPSSANYTTLQNITINLTAYDDLNLTDVKLYVNDVLNQTNASGINNSDYLFDLNLGDGDYTIYGKATDNESQETNSSSIRIVINTTPFIEFVSPTFANETNLTTIYIPINVTLTETYFKNVTFYFYKGGVLNETKTFTNSTRFYNKTACTCDTWKVNATVWTTTGQSNSTETRTYLIDVAPPSIINLLPNSTQDFILKGNNQSVTWNVTDLHIDSCWINYNGTNITVNCSSNLTQIEIQNSSTNTLIFYANDTFGNLANEIISWDYKIFEKSQTYNAETTEGNLEDFSAEVNILNSLSVSQAILTYNTTQYTGSSSLSGELTTFSKTSFFIPEVSADTNITFYWNITLSDDSKISLTSYNQTIYNIALDNCSVYTNKILNFTIYDEEMQNKINASAVDVELEIAVNIYSSDRATNILNLSHQYTTNPTAICLSRNLSASSTYSLDSIIRYTSTGYANEYYNIVNLVLTNDTGTQNIKLYNLNLSDSTEFQLTFIGGDYIAVESALVYVERQYIAENTFKTVELPLTDTNGQTILHLVKNDIVYNLIIIKDGVVLGNFRNILAFCEDYSIGDCKINLNAFDSVEDVFNTDDFYGITFTAPKYNETQDKITFDFTSIDGTTKTVLMEVSRNDIFGNRSICNSTLISSGGTITCDIDPNLDESVLRINIYVDNSKIIVDSVTLDTSNYGEAGYLIFFIMSISIILMFSGSKTGILFGIILSFGMAIGLRIINSDMIGVGASGIWLIVIVILAIWKLNKERIQ